MGTYPYLYLDARYEYVRRDGQVRDAAVLLASGVSESGKREMLGVSVSLSEAEVHWRGFLEKLVARGLQGVELIVSDDHAGLRKARRAVFGGLPWQRCQFHLQQNVGSYVPRKALRKEVAADLRMIFDAPERAQAERYLKQVVAKYAEVASDLADWIEENIPEGLAVFEFPKDHRTRLCTTNGLERVSQEIKRCTRVVRIFPNEASCLRLISAVLMEISEDWETGKVYLSMDTG